MKKRSRRPPKGSPRRQRSERNAEMARPVPASGDLIPGRVVAIASGACLVESDGQTLHCVLPSRLAFTQRSAVAVGDRVHVHRDEAPAEGGSGLEVHRVVEVLPRQTVLARPDPRHPLLERVLAANVDVVVHVASVVEPPLRLALIDRYLLAIERGGAQPLVAVNKLDLLPAAERPELLATLAPYRDLDVPVLLCSVGDGEGLEALRQHLAGKTAVFVGHSGVGKSSLINALDATAGAETGATSRSDGKGRHTTTRSSLYRLAGDIEVIDTPGIREFGLGQLTLAELRALFPDLEELAVDCRFADCSHLHEPGCAVQEAVAAGTLSPARYAAYQRLHAELGKG